MEVLRQVIGLEPPPIEELAPHVPPEIGEVLHRALAKDPEQRFADIGDFASALLLASGASLPPPIEQPLSIALSLTGSPPASVPRPPALERRYQTGMRTKTPPDASARTIGAACLTLGDVTRALEQARQAHGMGDTELAVNNAETALVVSESLATPEALASVEASRALIDSIFEARLGPLSQRMVVQPPASHPNLRVSPEQAFLLSRVDGGVTLDEAIDLSPLPRQKTLRLLVSMLRQGLIAAE
jgi:serine/threonine-protein kinase